MLDPSFIHLVHLRAYMTTPYQKHDNSKKLDKFFFSSLCYIKISKRSNSSNSTLLLRLEVVILSPKHCALLHLVCGNTFKCANIYISFALRNKKQHESIS